MVRRRVSRGHGRRSRVLVPFLSFSPVVAPCNRTERPSSPNRPSSLSSEGNQPSHDAMMDSSALRDARDPSRAVTMTTRIIAPVGAFALGAYAENRGYVDAALRKAREMDPTIRTGVDALFAAMRSIAYLSSLLTRALHDRGDRWTKLASSLFQRGGLLASRFSHPRKSGKV